MKPMDYIDLMRQATSSDVGLRLIVDQDIDGWAARQVRRRLYQSRDRARHRGDNSFDRLSFLLRVIYPSSREFKWELWIVRRDRLPAETPREDGFRADARPLEESELPRMIFARGRNRKRQFRSIPFLSVDSPRGP